MNNLIHNVGRYIDLMFDLGFKRVFGKEANKDILISFLNEFIPDRHIVDLNYLNVEQTGLAPDNKKSYFDVQCRTDDGSFIIVEVQNAKQKHFRERVLYYASLPVLKQLERGSMYDLVPVYVLSILNFKLDRSLGDESEVVSTYSVREDNTGERMTDILHLIFIELGRFGKTLEELVNDKEKWYFCLLHMNTFLERPPCLQAEIFKRLFNVAEVETLPEDEKEQYIKEMAIERDILNQREFAREEGRAQGIEQGRAQGKIEVARSMLAKGMSVQDIVEITGLEESQIREL